MNSPAYMYELVVWGLGIELFSNGLKQVVEVLNPLVRDKKSVDTLRSELAGLQEDLSKAHAQVYLSLFCACRRLLGSKSVR